MCEIKAGVCCEPPLEELAGVVVVGENQAKAAYAAFLSWRERRPPRELSRCWSFPFRRSCGTKRVKHP